MDKTVVHSGCGFLPLLTVLFIGLKLTHFIDWSWWWVLSPIWIPFAVLAGFAMAGVTLITLGEVFGSKRS